MKDIIIYFISLIININLKTSIISDKYKRLNYKMKFKNNNLKNTNNFYKLNI